jgi:hypothetical protein
VKSESPDSCNEENLVVPSGSHLTTLIGRWEAEAKAAADRQAAALGPPTSLSRAPTPVSRDELLRRVGNGLYIGRICYTYPINGPRAGVFTCTVIADFPI